MIEGTDTNQIEKVARAICRVDLGNMSDDALAQRQVDRMWEAWETHAKAAIAAMQPAPQWQGIESAPRDGTRMILAKFVGHPAHETALWWAVAGHWSDKWQNWNDGVEPCGLAGPTHWMPLPTTPAGGSDAE